MKIYRWDKFVKCEVILRVYSLSLVILKNIFKLFNEVIGQ